MEPIGATSLLPPLLYNSPLPRAPLTKEEDFLRSLPLLRGGEGWGRVMESRRAIGRMVSHADTSGFLRTYSCFWLSLSGRLAVLLSVGSIYGSTCLTKRRHYPQCNGAEPDSLPTWVNG